MRVIRVLVYEGDPEEIERTFRKNGVKGYHEVSNGALRIYESLIGYEYPKQNEVKDG